MGRIIIGALLVVVGIFTVIFSRQIYENWGANRWAEEKLGGAGTLTLIRIIGVTLILFGFFVWFRIFDLIFGGIGETLFGGFKDLDV